MSRPRSLFEVLPTTPNTGGLELCKIHELRQPGRTSEKRVVVLKGWAGRALVGIRAVSFCVEPLRGYRVAVCLAGPDVVLAAWLFSESTGVPCKSCPTALTMRSSGFMGRLGSQVLSFYLRIPRSSPWRSVAGSRTTPSSTRRPASMRGSRRNAWMRRVCVDGGWRCTGRSSQDTVRYDEARPGGLGRLRRSRRQERRRNDV